ncbi:MAG: hypothetical protein ACRC2R_12355 [Xenococcaceae cyanobacterium]
MNDDGVFDSEGAINDVSRTLSLRRKPQQTVLLRNKSTAGNMCGD